MSTDAQVPFLTQEAYDRLVAELEHLSTTGREEIAKRIEAAREEGDLKENGGYHAAKDEQGKQAEDREGRRGSAQPRHRRAGHGRHGRRRGRRRGLPARQPRDRCRQRPRRLQRGEPARPGHPRTQGRREVVVRGAERPLDLGRDRQRRDLHGLTDDITKAPSVRTGPSSCAHPGGGRHLRLTPDAALLRASRHQVPTEDQSGTTIGTNPSRRSVSSVKSECSGPRVSTLSSRMTSLICSP
jgi:hypothetical protein